MYAPTYSVTLCAPRTSCVRVLGQGLRSISRRPLEDRHKHARSDRQSSLPLPSIHIHPPPAPPLPPHLRSHTPPVEYRDQSVMHNLHVYQTKKIQNAKTWKTSPFTEPAKLLLLPSLSLLQIAAAAIAAAGICQRTIVAGRSRYRRRSTLSTQSNPTVLNPRRP